MKKLPDAYGGNRILKVDRYKELDNLRIITVERLSRGDIEAVYGALSNFKETLNKFRAQTPRIRSRKLRTELYYQLLGSRGRRKAVVIPDDYRMVGIRENQFKRGKRSKIDKLDIKQPAHH
jgi:hypothetical protein